MYACKKSTPHGLEENTNRELLKTGLAREQCVPVRLYASWLTLLNFESKKSAEVTLRRSALGVSPCGRERERGRERETEREGERESSCLALGTCEGCEQGWGGRNWKHHRYHRHRQRHDIADKDIILPEHWALGIRDTGNIIYHRHVYIIIHICVYKHVYTYVLWIVYVRHH